jgi:hypothetical protein
LIAFSCTPQPMMQKTQRGQCRGILEMNLGKRFARPESAFANHSKPDDRNADWLIFCNAEPASNVTVSRNSQPEKHFPQSRNYDRSYTTVIECILVDSL